MLCHPERREGTSKTSQALTQLIAGVLTCNTFKPDTQTMFGRG